MEIIWMPDPERDYLDTLDFWYRHNGSYSYSEKIFNAILKLEKEISEDPYFRAKYYKKANLYRRTILKGRFLVYYEIIEEVVNILYFRSSYQQPIEKIL